MSVDHQIPTSPFAMPEAPPPEDGERWLLPPPESEQSLTEPSAPPRFAALKAPAWLASRWSWVALGFVALVLCETVLGGVLQYRSQQVLARQFADELSVAAGAAGSSDLTPVPAVPPAMGAPVATLKIPAIGLEQTVVEGQSTPILQTGPGHVPGTPLPGQAGNSAIVGRRATFGAPFADLTSLKPGDAIEVTTVMGTSRYVVREAGVPDSDPFEASTGSVISLVTSNPAFVAAGDYVVTADLQGAPLPPSPQNPRTWESARAGDFSHWAEAVVWSLVLALVCCAAWMVAKRRLVPPPVLWLLAMPTAVAVMLLVVRAVDAFFPATL